MSQSTNPQTPASVPAAPCSPISDQWQDKVLMSPTPGTVCAKIGPEILYQPGIVALDLNSIRLQPPRYRSCIPSPNNIYILRDLVSRKVLSLRQGHVGLCQPDDPSATSPFFSGAIFWECCEQGGWMSLKNVISGGRLGLFEIPHYGTRVKAACMINHSKLVIQPDEDGDGFRVRIFADDLSGIYANDDELFARMGATAQQEIWWEFIKVAK